MSILTDTDITRLINNEIIIEPFEINNLTPLGYDLTVGEVVISLKRGVLPLDKDRCYRVKPKETVLVLTREYLWISGRLAGTFHSKVSMVSRGFSGISTTLDPEWKGRVLISITNLSDKTLTMAYEQPFATLLLYRTLSRATKDAGKPASRLDIIFELYNRTNPKNAQRENDKSRDALVNKLAELFADKDAKEVATRIQVAQKDMGQRLAMAASKMLQARGKYIFNLVVHFLAIFLVIYLGWNLELWYPSLKQSVLIPISFSAATGILMNAIKLSYD